ncbi:MAG: hemerythrin domain-containing protein [Rhodocyclales bacterium]|nr:hemerythrin domain-containing protein [Rhodocyclales bacterium]
MIEAFVWQASFETGIASIDQQHRHLVGLINELGDVLVAGSTEKLDGLVRALQDYVLFHFADEERVMVANGLDRDFMVRHYGLHTEFKQQLAGLAGGGNASAEQAANLHEFLSAWLVLHILGEDQVLARRILFPDQGQERPPPDHLDEGQRVLLSAVHRLYRALSRSNAELARMNADLERRVAERTRALEQANEELESEREELVQALRAIEQARMQLIEKEKMASIGQLAAGIAHEINNPIGFVSANLGTLREYVSDVMTLLDAYVAMEPLIASDPQALDAIRQLSEDADIGFVREDVHKLLDESSNGLLRVKQIVQNLRNFSHAGAVEWQLANLHDELDSTLTVAASELRGKAEVRREYGDLPLLHCHPGQLNQVFLNLLINAAQAMESPGVITIRTGCDRREDGSGWGWVEIEDDGCGIAAEDLGRIFEPFFTTKPVGVGTGLGLSLSWGIVQQHGGTMEAHSVLGRGSRFRVLLPLANERGGPSL